MNQEIALRRFLAKLKELQIHIGKFAHSESRLRRETYGDIEGLLVVCIQSIETEITRLAREDASNEDPFEKRLSQLFELGKQDDMLDNTDYLTSLANLSNLNKVPLKNVAILMKGLIQALDANEDNDVTHAEQTLAPSINKLLEIDFKAFTNPSDILEKAANKQMVQIAEPIEIEPHAKLQDDVLADDISPLPIDPVKLNDFELDLNIRNKESFDESFRKFLWLAINDAKVNIYIENYPIENDQKQGALREWKKRNIKLAFDKVLDQLANAQQEAPDAVAEYSKRISEFVNSTVGEHKSFLAQSNAEKNSINPSAMNIIAVQRMINTLSAKSGFAETDVNQELQNLGTTAEVNLKNFQSDASYKDKYKRVALDDPEFSPFIADSVKCKLTNLYLNLVKLESDNSSESMKDMIQSVRNILTTPYSNFSLGNEQLTKDLGMCELACYKYLDTHKSHPFTKEGRDRVAAAKSLSDISKAFCEQSWKIIETKKRSEHERLHNELGDRISAESIKKSWLSDADFDKLLQSSKLQSALEPVHFRPSMHKEVKTVSVFSKIFNIASKITSGLQRLIARTSWFTTRAAKRAIAKTDEEVRENIKKVFPAAASPQIVNKQKTDAEGLYYDQRRIPLAWAREIPEDPEQGIELSVNVTQAIDGSDVAMGYSKNGSTESDAPGKSVNDAGHAFFTLKYTRIDPVSGEKRRYQTAFGFGGGEYGPASAHVNSFLTGSMIPGAIHNDEKSPVSIGRKFNISPQQFNKLIDFTEGYAKGGYHLFTRNCCRFVADACKHIDLKGSEDLFVEGDARFTPLGNLGILAGALGTLLIVPPISQPITQLAASNEATKYAGAPSFSFQNFGDALVMPTDIKQMQANKGLITLHGLTPGAIGERIRAGYGKNFYSTRWEPNRQDAPEGQPRSTMAKIQNDALINAIRTRMTPVINKMKRVDRLPEMHRLEKIIQSIQRNYDTLGVAIENGLRYLYKNNRTLPIKKYRSICIQLNKAVTTYRENILDIYHNALKSDDALNLEFSKMLSTIEQKRMQIRASFEDYKLYAVKNMSITDSDLSSFIDTRREAISSLTAMSRANAVHAVGKDVQIMNKKTKKIYRAFIGSDGTPFGLLAIYDVCESMEDYIKAPKDKRALVYELRKVCEQKADPNIKFTEREIRMIFNQIPKDESDPQYKPRPEPKMSASDVLKGFLFEKCFSGFGPKIRNMTEKFLAFDYPIEEPSRDYNDSPEMERDENNIRSFFANMMTEGLKFINEKLKQNDVKEVFDIMVSAKMDYEGSKGQPIDESAAAELVKLEVIKILYMPQFTYHAFTTIKSQGVVQRIAKFRNTNNLLQSMGELTSTIEALSTYFNEMYANAINCAKTGQQLDEKAIFEDYTEPNYENKAAEFLNGKLNQVNNDNEQKENVRNVNILNELRQLEEQVQKLDKDLPGAKANQQDIQEEMNELPDNEISRN